MTPSEIVISPQHLFTISEIAARSSDWKEALNEITREVRSVLLFDNLVVYQIETGEQLNVIYARALGRGQKAEADVSWGESLAAQIAEKQRPIIEEPDQLENGDRLQKPYLLGVPVIELQKLIGVMVLIRFGGPRFSQNDIRLAGFISRQIALLAARQTLEEERTQKEKEQQQAQLKEDFISTISHDLRTPLGYIKGYTTTLLRSDTEWDRTVQQEFLQIIEQETDHLQELIDNLLDSTRLASGQLMMVYQPVRLDALLNDVLARLRFQNPDIKTSLKLPDHLAPIQGDPHRLAQVFQNILGNSVKYAPGTMITISVKQNDQNTRISFRDRGPGIPHNFLPLIFDRFFRGPDRSSNTHGSGLGLFICKKIIQAHKGQINARSVEGSGATFQIIIPNDFET
jgi:signal transduction histidine kinase